MPAAIWAKAMPYSTTSAFTEQDEFQAALHSLGGVSLFSTAPGNFHARLTQIGLHKLRLAVVQESLPRIGFLAVPQDELLISFPLGPAPLPIWGGVKPQADEFTTIGPGYRLHIRTEGPCRWGAIWFPAQDLANYFRELTGNALTISPFVQLWHPPAAARRRMLHFHTAAIRAAQVQPTNIVSIEAAHGIEQQLVEAVVECLSDGEEPARRHHPEIMARFEELLQSRRQGDVRIESLRRGNRRLGTAPALALQGGTGHRARPATSGSVHCTACTTSYAGGTRARRQVSRTSHAAMGSANQAVLQQTIVLCSVNFHLLH